MTSSARVAIIGRPNVGKSTLFNRLVGKRLALVDDQPGVTRDRREGAASLAGLSFIAIDTAGLEDDRSESLEGRMRQQTERAVTDADVVLFVVDARAGITPLDSDFGRWLRRQNRPVILVANKAEGCVTEANLMESHALGFGSPVAISAEHGEGMGDLYDALAPFIGGRRPEEPSLPTDIAVVETDIAAPLDIDGEDVDETRPLAGPLQLAVIGRPNVGKSTLINRLIGEERLLTGPEAGITRDAIAIDWTYRDRHLRLIDTAGLRRRARITDKVEKLSAADSVRALRFAHVVILTTSAEEPLEKQDLTLARLVADEGRAIIIAVTKWDQVENPAEMMRRLRDRLADSLPQCRDVTIVPVSGLTGYNLSALLDACLAAYDVWNKRISTPALNRWLRHAVATHTPPAVAGRRIKLRFMTQAAIRPPRFVLFTNLPKDIPDSYIRYLTNAMRDDFKLPGTPIRIVLRKGENPYAEDRKP